MNLKADFGKNCYEIDISTIMPINRTSANSMDVLFAKKYIKLLETLHSDIA